MSLRCSLAQWSCHRMLYGKQLEHLDFPKLARERFGIGAVEYVSGFFKDKAKDAAFLDEMNRRCADLAVRQLLIMVDGEGRLGDPDEAKRAEAIENHKKWVMAAVQLGCHSIRVNAASEGPWEQQAALAADGLRRLAEWAKEATGEVRIDVIVENHGGLSSNGNWLREVMLRVDHQRCGTLPDFGNFHVGANAYGPDWFDRYLGIERLMRFARAVSAKSHDFDDQGNETGTDYPRMLEIVLKSGYDGWVGIEYEGSRLPELDGIERTKRLLQRLGVSVW